MVSFILHMRSARRVSLSLSLSGLDKPVAWKGDHLLLPPRTGPGVGATATSWRGAARPSIGVRRGGEPPSSRFVYSPAMASVSLRVALDFLLQFTLCPSPALAAHAKPPRLFGEGQQGKSTRGTPTKINGQPPPQEILGNIHFRKSAENNNIPLKNESKKLRRAITLTLLASARR